MTQAQVTKTKTAAKTAPAKKAAAKTSTKPAAKSAPAKKTTKKAATVAANGAQFYIKDSFRPGAGGLLFAYTAAWLQETGLVDGGAIPRADATKLAGATAIGYHVNDTGRFVDNGGMISLAPDAAPYFFEGRRTHADAQREAYREMLRTGKPDGTLIKQAAAFGKLAAE
jgi:hypothetical protein